MSRISRIPNLLINSTLAFVSAFVITTFIHELGHFLSYFMFGENPTLFHNYVQTPGQDISKHVKVISALAGPVISLVQGTALAMVVSIKRKNTSAHLFFLWLSLLGLVNFFGYLIMTPFSATGDTGKVAELLKVPEGLRILIAVVGFAVLIPVILRVGRNFSNFIPAEHKTKYVYRIMFFPILIGSALNTLLAFPVVAILSIIYPATSSYAIMISFSAILKAPAAQSPASELGNRIKKSLVFLTLFAIILNRVLTTGVG